MQIQVYTLNINGFRGAGGRPGDRIAPEICRDGLERLKELADRLLTEPGGVMVLQEVPHQQWDSACRRWREDPLHQAFAQLFSQTYKVIWPRRLIPSRQCTAALCRKDSFWEPAAEERIRYNARYDFGNKLVELQWGDRLTLLGVHMSPDEDMWALLFRSWEGEKHTLVAGDFNAYEKRGEMRGKPGQIRAAGYVPFLPCCVLTNYRNRSSIDNLYIRREMELAGPVSVSAGPPAPFCTDHALCGVSFFLDD